MTDLTEWKKSSFSGADNNQNCVHVRAGDHDEVLILESDTPESIVTTNREKFKAFVLGVKAGEFDYLTEDSSQD